MMALCAVWNGESRPLKVPEGGASRMNPWGAREKGTPYLFHDEGTPYLFLALSL